MKTTHKIIFGNSKKLNKIPSNSVDLMITSPPYPMIEMWDEMFSKQNPKISDALDKNKGDDAFELMHNELDFIWDETCRVLKEGGIACVNIGDATRTIDGEFKLYNNHSRIINHFVKKGLHNLPNILWIKETNKPNKFMGSGMLPVGAYVTLEHEYILIFRKGKKRKFKSEEEKENRQKSAFFWEERNSWFSDRWSDIKGASQKTNDEKTRLRTAEYPLELAYRLINMFSVQGDVVLDPFLGTGTTSVAAVVSARNSIGVEIDSNFKNIIYEKVKGAYDLSIEKNQKRIKNHHDFIEKKGKEEFSYDNLNHNFPVMTRQEILLKLPSLKEIKQQKEGLFEANYE